VVPVIRRRSLIGGALACVVACAATSGTTNTTSDTGRQECGPDGGGDALAGVGIATYDGPREGCLGFIEGALGRLSPPSLVIPQGQSATTEIFFVRDGRAPPLSVSVSGLAPGLSASPPTISAIATGAIVLS
jgi:hypothetical protein